VADDPAERRQLYVRALEAATRGQNIVPAGLGVAAAGGLLAVGLAPIAAVVGALSAVTWGALVAWDLASHGGALPPAPEPAPEEPVRLAAEHLQRRLDAVSAAARRVREPIDRYEGVLTDSLLEVGAASEELVERATALARRGDAIWRYLSANDPKQIEAEIAERRKSAGLLRDPTAAASLRQAADAKQEQLATWTALRDQHDRIAAELVAVDASLDALHARVVALTLNDPGDTAAGASIGAEIHALGQRMGLLERAAAETIRSLSA
jgi:peptidoglycan/xylan/chitin deacetylase (PgdA/CDA1 family)